MAELTVALASDHAGVELKEIFREELTSKGFKVLDLGTNSKDSVDYPDFADKMASTLENAQADRGILICGTGIGISIAANRHKSVRAALCHNSTDAKFSRLHNDANVLALGARTMGPEVALDCLKVFLETEFEGGRHAARVAKMS
ncbi:ribose 5-phosphate isomerase B [Aestuariispira ectoiniformans]|uniref:ribose 5-phosphate isomerase B n=1 Tax=Aestuariispira ectoiniformans TaxID=2775080 RepID=UPI00223AC9ED|nr:ribose 5-phosphate isomerase B [Aestuariispira ectoiniformans]